MNEKTYDEFQWWFSLVSEVMSDSPHSGDDRTYERYIAIEEKLQELVESVRARSIEFERDIPK